MDFEQVIFVDHYDGSRRGGILVEDAGEDAYIICGCCGDIFKLKQVTILETRGWKDISKIILEGEE